MTAKEWDERYEGTHVPVRCRSRSGRITSPITTTAGFARDDGGTSDVFVHGFGRVPLSELEVVSEEEARASFMARAESDLRDLASVRGDYPVAELELAHRHFVASRPTLRELQAHASAVAQLWSRWQGDVYAD